MREKKFHHPLHKNNLLSNLTSTYPALQKTKACVKHSGCQQAVAHSGGESLSLEPHAPRFKPQLSLDGYLVMFGYLFHPSEPSVLLWKMGLITTAPSAPGIQGGKAHETA